MGTALEKYRERMAVEADDYAEDEKVSSTFISLRGGVLAYGEEELPGNEMLVIVLDAIHENTYYPDDFDPDVKLPPKCFAFGRKEKDMEAHESVPGEDEPGAETSYFELQAATCAECEWSKWGSARKGKGKACSNRRRLAVIPAGRFTPTGKRNQTEAEVFEDPEHFREAEMAFLKLPVTSVKNWSRYVQGLRRDHQAPPFAAITHIYVERDPKSQFKVFFDLVEVIEDEDLLEILFARNEEARDQIEIPYEEPSEEEKEAPKAKAKSGLSGLRKKRRDDD